MQCCHVPAAMAMPLVSLVIVKPCDEQSAIP